jgi:hypothetical protein
VQEQELVDAQEQNQANEQDFPLEPSPLTTTPSDSAPANTMTTARGTTSSLKTVPTNLTSTT